MSILPSSTGGSLLNSFESSVPRLQVPVLAAPSVIPVPVPELCRDPNHSAPLTVFHLDPSDTSKYVRLPVTLDRRNDKYLVVQATEQFLNDVVNIASTELLETVLASRTRNAPHTPPPSGRRR
jgi:hypothetical protein